MECYNKDCEHRFRTIEKSINAINSEIEKLKEDREKTNIDVALFYERLDNIRDKLDDLTKEVSKLNSKDGQSWDKAKWIIISCIITGIITFIFAKLGLK